MNWNVVDISSAVGGITTVILLFRILFIIDHEFSEEDKIVKNPLSAAVDESTTYAKFRSNDWQAYAALWAAMRFKQFFKFFEFILEPKSSKLCVVVLGALYLGLIVPAYAQPWSTVTQGLIPALAALVNTVWLIIIERAKRLKKSVANLKLN